MRLSPSFSGFQFIVQSFDLIETDSSARVHLAHARAELGTTGRIIYARKKFEVDCRERAILFVHLMDRSLDLHGRHGFIVSQSH